MKTLSFFLSFIILSVQLYPMNSVPNIENQWNGKRVAFLGDSITDKVRVGTKKCYWEYLAEMLGIQPFVYAINGNQMSGILAQAERLKREQNDSFDAIIIFAGTNDYNADVPLGEWYSETEAETWVSGPKKERRAFRKSFYGNNTFKGRINILMRYLKTNYPTKQIILLTPIHRGYARFGDNNIQPEESFANRIGLYIDDYVEVIKEAASVWAVPVIDLNSLSGLYPVSDSHAAYFHDGKTDRLHPNENGHRRMAETLKYQLLALPSAFE